MAAQIEIKYFNTFILKKTLEPTEEIGGLPAITSDAKPVWNGSFGIPTALGGWPKMGVYAGPGNWTLEEARIQGGYNNTSLGYGAKAYITEEDTFASTKFNSLIYSGIFNSRTGVNKTNQFSVGENITKSVDPANGSVQKLYAEDTNLTIFQELKVSRALIDKDAIYSAEGGGTVTSSEAVIGQVQAYAGNYGISKDPDSFAVYGYRKYFTDKNRNAVLRLSQDGITEISEYGMVSFFRDKFNTIDSPLYGPGLIVGGWDIHNKQYVLSIQDSTPAEPMVYSTLAFDEQVSGFTSFFNYKPSHILSLKNKFYTLHNGSLWQHYSNIEPRNSFYDEEFKSSIVFIFNEEPSLVKSFKTINYEGSNGWMVDYFLSDVTGVDLYNGTPTNYQDSTPLVYSYTEGAYDNYGNEYPDALIPPLNYAGFDRKENKYKANLINNSLPQPGEISYGNAISGIKGYFATVKISTDTKTDLGGAKELFTVSTEIVRSSY